MSQKKKIIIALCIIFFSFLITIIGIIYRKSKLNNNVIENDIKHDYAINETTQATTTEVTTENNIVKEDKLEFSSIEYSGLDKLNAEQYADKLSMVKKINNYVTKEVKDIEITKADSEVINATITYTDDKNEDIVLTFDPYITHGFMRCVSKEYHDYIQSGQNAG